MKQYNRRSIRLAGYDYDQAGNYFVTICSYKREEVFGQIKDNEMILTDLGRLVEECLEEMKCRFKIGLDEYVIMPNHVHMIINIVGANHDSPKNDEIIEYGRAIRESPLRGNKRSLLSKIIGYFKAKVSRDFGMQIWQRGYFDRIIRNEKELNKIRQYIKLNPMMWDRDRNNLIF